MLKHYIKLHFIILIFGFTAILGKLTLAHPLSLIIYRTGIAFLVLFVIIKFQKISLKFSAREISKFLFVGALLGAHWLCFFGSARLSNVSISLVAVSTTSFFTSLIEPFLHKKKINFLEVAFGFMAILGMVIIFNFELKYISGLLVGLFGAIIGAMFSLYNGTLSNFYDSKVISFYELIGAALFAVLLVPVFSYYGFISTNVFIVSINDILWLAILAVGCTVYPYVEMINLYKKFSVFTVNLSLNMEPIYGIILAILIFGQSEKMSIGFYIGGTLVFMSVIFQPLFNKKALSN